jgi:hypothetical protein
MSFQIGDKVWSALFGDGEVDKINESSYPVGVTFNNRGRTWHTHDGRYVYNQLPTLFHAGTKLIPAPEPERVKPELKFEPFQKVLVRDDCSSTWRAHLYSHYDPKYLHRCLAGFVYPQCIPYEGNEHLLGTADDPDEAPA